jgi:dipeptidyl aminopeptidase/acylaminoacyl peptidase
LCALAAACLTAQIAAAPSQGASGTALPPSDARTVPSLRHLLEGESLDGLTAISPDGQRVGYVRTRGSVAANRRDSELWLAPAHGGEHVRLATSDQAAFQPAWSPDGRWIAFLSMRNGAPQVCAQVLDTGKEVQLRRPNRSHGPSVTSTLPNCVTVPPFHQELVWVRVRSSAVAPPRRRPELVPERVACGSRVARGEGRLADTPHPKAEPDIGGF